MHAVDRETNLNVGARTKPFEREALAKYALLLALILAFLSQMFAFFSNRTFYKEGSHWILMLLNTQLFFREEMRIHLNELLFQIPSLLEMKLFPGAGGSWAAIKTMNFVWCFHPWFSLSCCALLCWCRKR